jgi:MFS family permease
MIAFVRQGWLRSRAGVLAERNFRTFYVGYVTSLFGTAMSSVAIAWAVLESTGSPSGLGLVMASNVVPQVALLAVAGAVADRLGRRRVMLSADALRCCAQGTLAVAVLAGRPPLWTFLLLGWLRGSGEAFFSPAFDALTVEIAPPDQLGNANALYGIAGSASRIGGPSLAGVLVAVAGPGSVIAVDAASYAVSVLALSLLRLPPGAAAATVLASRRGALWRDMKEGWSDFRSRTWLWVMSLHWAFFNLITWAPWMILGPVQGQRYLGGAAVWGVIMAIQGAGAIVGGLAWLGRRPSRPVVVAVIAMFGYAMPDIPMALHAAVPWVAIGAFICGLGSSATFFTAAMQQQVPRDRLARVSSLTMFSSFGIGVIGYGIDGPLAAVFGVPAVFAAGAIYGFASSALLLTLPSVRGVRWRESSVLPGGRAERGERGQPGRHGDDDRDRQPLRDVGGRRERDDSESHRHAADG